MDYRYYTCCLLLVLSLLCLQVSCTETNVNQSLEEKFGVEVWDDPGAIKTIIDRQKFAIDDLIKLFERLNQLNSASQNQKDLVEINILDNKKCSANLYAALKRSHEFYKNFATFGSTKACFNYVKDRFEKWMNFCVPQINRDVKAAIMKIGEEKAALINLLRKTILQADPKKEYPFVSWELPKQNYIIGSLKFMKRDNLLGKKIFHRKTGSETFNGQSIFGLCDKVLKEFRSIKKYFDEFERFVWTHQVMEVGPKLDEDVLIWRDNHTICNYIRDIFRSVEVAIYNSRPF